MRSIFSLVAVQHDWLSRRGLLGFVGRALRCIGSLLSGGGGVGGRIRCVLGCRSVLRNLADLRLEVIDLRLQLLHSILATCHDAERQYGGRCLQDNSSLHSIFPWVVSNFGETTRSLF